MGNKASVATIHVSFDNHDVVSGSTVTGKVYLAIHQDTVSCVSVGSRVVGKERTEVTYTVTVGSGDRRHTERRTAYEQRHFMDLKFCLQQVPSGNMYKGQYEYPFQFTIPTGAPATMSAGNNADNCGISYSMEVWLDRPGLLRWDIRNHMYVNVTNPPPVGRNMTPLYIEPGRYPLMTCCCFRRGDVLIGGAAESSVLTAGCQSFVKYAVENNSTVTIKAIEVIISEHINFRAQGYRGSAYAKLFHKRLTPREAGMDLSPRSSQKIDTGDGLETLRILSRMLESDNYKINISVPSYARNTYNGSIIQVIHKLEIKAITSFGTANPSVWRYIQLYSQQRPGSMFTQSVKPSDLPALPQDWKPQVAEPVLLPSLALSSAPPVVNDDDDNKPIIYATAVAISSKKDYVSFEQFSAAISRTYDPCGELEKYIQDGNSVDALTPEQFYVMFKAVNDVFDQQRFADILAAALTSITCTKVARALAGSRAMCKREVAEKLLNAGPILDKIENAHLVKSELTPFQYMTIEKYFIV